MNKIWPDCLMRGFRRWRLRRFKIRHASPTTRDQSMTVMSSAQLVSSRASRLSSITIRSLIVHAFNFGSQTTKLAFTIRLWSQVTSCGGSFVVLAGWISRILWAFFTGLNLQHFTPERKRCSRTMRTSFRMIFMGKAARLRFLKRKD